jgi:hypothetical protein
VEAWLRRPPSNIPAGHRWEILDVDRDLGPLFSGSTRGFLRRR